ncbi:Retrovirus-related Pol polyprotein from transposon TNT 1-94 [Vitis vinifera]|uniref:Retrovirus-related Pol polyprotein from transposon TNT 1-94 n=1 Tax=Vitis vinifera TaxID=29760 RepID=A0A438G776_VITVI|nr:Retrovirus-related Pol polyprotein from transposon TNT 1-94 [Vitis vinifera]
MYQYAAWREKKGTLPNFVCSEINLAVVPTNTWWIDTGATTHISVTMQGCLRSRMPTDGERYIYVGNGNKTFVVHFLPIHGNEQQYFITFIDDYSRYDYLYLIHEKSQSLDVFKNFKAEVENQLSKKIKAVRSDRGGEYYGRYDGSGEQRLGPFAKYLMECGIVSQYTMPGTPSQNGVSERRNRTLKDMVRTEARPYKPNEKKLDSRTVSCYFVGYSERSRGFKFYDPSTRSFFETGNAKFIEDVELSGKRAIKKGVRLTGIQDTPEIPPCSSYGTNSSSSRGNSNNLKNLKYKCH